MFPLFTQFKDIQKCKSLPKIKGEKVKNKLFFRNQYACVFIPKDLFKKLIENITINVNHLIFCNYC